MEIHELNEQGDYVPVEVVTPSTFNHSFLYFLSSSSPPRHHHHHTITTTPSSPQRHHHHHTTITTTPPLPKIFSIISIITIKLSSPLHHHHHNFITTPPSPPPHPLTQVQQKMEVPTGGIHQLRQGFSRRILVRPSTQPLQTLHSHSPLQSVTPPIHYATTSNHHSQPHQTTSHHNHYKTIPQAQSTTQTTSLHNHTNHPNNSELTSNHHKVSVRPVQNSGTLPIILESVTQVQIGCSCPRSKLQKGLDSYQEEDLALLRHKWSEALEKRREYLDEQLQRLMKKNGVQGDGWKMDGGWMEDGWMMDGWRMDGG